jgi:hypothetical protein
LARRRPSDYEIRKAVFDVLSWAVRKGNMDEPLLIEDIQGMLEAEPSSLAPESMPAYNSHVTGHARFLQGEIAYEGRSSEKDNWRIIDDI